jgi:hypothetical protein
MNKVPLTTILLVLSINTFAQVAVDSVLATIERNNTTLLSYRKSVDAEKIGNKTGLAPQNPEVEFNYLWGNPSAIGNRTDFSVKQSFDFPTAYSYKNQIANLKNEQAELEYKKQRNELLYQTRVICVKLTYYNALKVELDTRKTNAQQVADAYKTKYNTGDVGILDYNKAQVNLLNILKEQENIKIERNTLLLELITLNGGNSINFSDSIFTNQTIPVDFEQWFIQSEANNPLLQWINQEITISEKEAKLNTAMSLPKLSGGYMSEKVAGEQFQGVTVGITLPLWENKNTVKYAKAKTIALQSIETDAKLQFYNSMKATHTKVIALQKNVSDYRSKLELYSNSALLEKAFNKGEISLTEYMYELSLYYESFYKLLEMEMSLNLGFAELIKYQ